MSLLSVRNLSIWFDDPARPAVDGVDLDSGDGRKLALVVEEQDEA